MTFVLTPTSFVLKTKNKMKIKYTLSRQVEQLQSSLYALLRSSSLSSTAFELKESHLL